MTTIRVTLDDFQVEDILDDVKAAFRELGKSLPDTRYSLIDERDQMDRPGMWTWDMGVKLERPVFTKNDVDTLVSSLGDVFGKLDGGFTFHFLDTTNNIRAELRLSARGDLSGQAKSLSRKYRDL